MAGHRRRKRNQPPLAIDLIQSPADTEETNRRLEKVERAIRHAARAVEVPHELGPAIASAFSTMGEEASRRGDRAASKAWLRIAEIYSEAAEEVGELLYGN